jgi:hypothetical protein
MRQAAPTPAARAAARRFIATANVGIVDNF